MWVVIVMKKRTKMIYLCFVGGCIFVGVLIASVFLRGADHEENSVKALDWKANSEILKIAFEDARVKEMVMKGGEYGITGINSTSRDGKSCWLVEMSVQDDGWANKVGVIVDLNEKRVLDIQEEKHFKRMPERGVTDEERKRAIEIALKNDIVKEKIKGLVYEIGWVDVAGPRRRGEIPKERLIMVNIGIIGANIVYIVDVNLSEGKVVKITEAYWGGRISMENKEIAREIAKNDSRVREIIFEGLSDWKELKGFVVEYMYRDKIVGGKLLVDVYMHREKPEPEIAIIATVDLEEGKVTEIKELSSWSPPEDYKVIYKQ